jgi:superfamily II DNA or RNA helicase
MLYGLDVERKRHDQWKNLMVAATGTGKTVVSAFDFKRLREEFGDLSLLFVAHRREILKQSRSTFRNVLREASFGELMVGDDRPVEGRHVFASIQSLHSKDVSKWAPDAFDVVIVDEFHHAEAKTYRKLLEHVQPRVLLGMTATPERTDGLDVKHWFNGRIAVELRLWDALEQGLLCPFQYFGVADDIDLSSLAWSRGGYEASELERLYTGNDVRLRKVLKAVDDIVEDSLQMRALGFCVSVAHARYMAERFNAAGIPSRAVTGQTNADDRKGALKLLERGEINVIFCVDLFNEGLDIPDVDTVLFLRPTESAVVFLQQLGRGLRRTDGKSGLTVLDFIGQQHRRFRYLDRFQALIGGNRRRIREQVEEGFPFLPAGCSIALDRQSEEIILANLKSSVSRVKSELVRELESIGDVSLSDFLDRTGHDLEDVYSGSKPGWTALRREAGFVHDADPEESLLEKALGRMLHIDDPLRVGAYSQGLVLATSPEWPTRDEREIRLWNMLHFDLWGADLSSTDLDSSMARLWRNPDVKDELRQLLVLSARNARHLALEAQLEADIPLSLHARYTRNEILAALGVASPERNPSWREGVKHIDRYDIDLLLVTLKKSDKRFSPSTMYRDYPISPSLFHWESQSTTSVASKTGQRCINHVRLGARILLFVREDAVGDALGASPFVFLGPVNYARHQGDRPIAITWELAHEMPPDFFEAAKAAV